MRFVFNEEHYQEILVNNVLKAKRFIWICTANVKDIRIIKKRGSVPFLKELAKLSGEGVEIRLIYGALPSKSFRDTFDGLNRLVKGGLEIQMCPRFHGKIIVVDGVFAYVGSANLTGAGLGAKSSRKRNFEAGAIFHDKKSVTELMDYYDRFWMGMECEDCYYKKDCPDPIV